MGTRDLWSARPHRCPNWGLDIIGSHLREQRGRENRHKRIACGRQASAGFFIRHAQRRDRMGHHLQDERIILINVAPSVERRRSCCSRAHSITRPTMVALSIEAAI